MTCGGSSVSSVTNCSRVAYWPDKRLELFDVARANLGGVVDAFELRLVPLAQPAELTGPLARIRQVATCNSISDDHSASAAAGMRYSASIGHA